MKHTIRKWISVLLALVMTATVFSFAASAASPKKYKVYTSLGNSIAAGFMLPDYKDKQEGDRHIVMNERVEGSYPAIVSDSIGATTTNYLAQPGLRTRDLRMLLDPTYEGDSITKNKLGGLTKNVAGVKEDVDYSQQTMEQQRKTDIVAVSQSDLVTLDIGMNDSMITMMGVLSDFENLDKIGQLRDALSYILNDWKTDYKAIVDRIYTLNPDVTIVAVGNYNPFRQWKVPGGASVGDLVQWYYDSMNEYKASLAKEYGGKLKFAPVPETDLNAGDIKTIADTKKIDFHPTADGHRYMAEQILAVL